MERAIILGELVKEVLGPRKGVNEKFPIDMDPRNEYIVGVLAPKEAQEERDVDAEAELMTDGESTDEDEIEESPEISYTGSPSLDPKSQPKSLGLSIIVEAKSDESNIEVCFTWARYVMNGTDWERVSYYDYQKVHVGTISRWCDKQKSGIEFTVKSIRLKDNKYKVSIFLVNNTTLTENSRPTTTDFVFQPEIRVNCLDGVLICSLENDSEEVCDYSEEVMEEHSLNLLYRERSAYARGHLVGVTWREIDPQRDHPEIHKLNFPPFNWVDGIIVDGPIRDKFIVPDVRTDYTPIYPVEAPSMYWREQYGEAPEFNPLLLADCWNADDLRSKLMPFVNGYTSWLDEQKSSPSLQELRPNQLRAAELHFSNIQTTINRMVRSIDLICDNEDIRLSFCFANKVMALQSTWANNRVNPWRPFQLAFILVNIASIADNNDSDREVADLLWFATGGGKTESYLGLAAFTMALQRRRAQLDRSNHKKGAGVNVLSRYTLRLLTIQQFRRALRVVTAAEMLRVQNIGNSEKKYIGWRPENCPITDDFIWGGERFSVGLWVGGGVTPNSLHSLNFRDENGVFKNIPGAMELLRKKGKNSDGEPAQVLNCPCCNSYVAIPNEGIGSGKHKLHFVFKDKGKKFPSLTRNQISLQDGTISNCNIVKHNNVYYTLTIEFEVQGNQLIESSLIDDLWSQQIVKILGNVELQAARPTRPGYFITSYINNQGTPKDCNFEIICPNPECELNQSNWAEKVPVSVSTQYLSGHIDTEYQDVLAPFQITDHPNISSRTVIPAYTVDDQIYHRCPSMIIATVDKFAQLPNEPRAATLFGNVEYYHSRWGYYRDSCPPNAGGSQASELVRHPAGFQRNQPLHKRVESFDPPQLIIQDELHLIEGPLGSLYGLYETAIDELCTKYQDGNRIPPKYIVSTATVRQAKKQVKTLFAREFAQFPPSGIDVDDNFFSTGQETHPLDDTNAGRLYVGICAPGKGAQTPLVRVWSSLLQTTENLKNAGLNHQFIDGFTTVVGYFNAIRELAGAASLYRQDIPERMSYQYNSQARKLSDNPLELSSRKSSTELPGLLEMLGNTLDDGSPEDGVLATSMFGTGVDVDRLRLMVINGQPKSTSSYIQASGRVGRKRGGLVVTFFRASRPRDLDHFEFFTGYHRALYKHVEPVTVAPFSPRAREKALGPLSVAFLRQASKILGETVPSNWRFQQRLQRQQVVSAATYMSQGRHSVEVQKIIGVFAQRIAQLPDGRRPDVSKVLGELRSELDRWYILAKKYGDLMYNEPSFARTPSHPVVLGDAQHFFRGLEVAYENSPQSLRDVESTTNFKS
ncbi:DISARM system helicase DrmA [Paenibacillus alvei]|uniref:Helicase n=1 Tax=Paenibacillus alvei TaxID=44250 RepID=A0AAP7A1K5_PAEAL|nr:DISARM system helicase DrmA [Paenibacillus alvei]NOJ73983.1 helicase [Paenibacillus alvei]